MMQIFSFFGSILGYLLQVLFYVFQNFGVSIIFFTIIIKAILFPFSVRQQKSMASSSRMQKKQKEIREKYANNKQKMNEEMQKLYEKEGVSPTGGCMTTLIPMLVLLGLFYSVAQPLTNTLHIDSTIIDGAMSYVDSIPGFFISGYAENSSNIYNQMNFVEVLKNNPDLFSSVPQFVNNPDIASSIQSFTNGFNFLGLDLLIVPSSQGFLSVYIAVPLICLIANVASQIITMRVNSNSQNQQGCMKFMMVAMPVFSAYIAFVVPAAVGFYWICSSVLSLIQSLIMGKYYNATVLTAKQEAQHVALLEVQEAAVKYVPTVNVNYNGNKKNKNKK